MSERIKDRDDEEVCAACSYPAKDLTEYSMNRYLPKKQEKKLLCELCAWTASGTAIEYPEQFQVQKETLFTLCFIGNAILDAIERRGAPAPAPEGKEK